MSLTDAWENKVLDAILGSNHSSVFPATVYVGLSTTAPNDDGTNFTEPTDTAYARVAVTNDTAHWPVASGSQKSNGVAIVFPTATASWGTITNFGIFEAATGGTPGFTGLLGTATVVNTGQSPDFAVGALVASAD